VSWKIEARFWWTEGWNLSIETLLVDMTEKAGALAETVDAHWIRCEPTPNPCARQACRTSRMRRLAESLKNTKQEGESRSSIATENQEYRPREVGIGPLDTQRSAESELARVGWSDRASAEEICGSVPVRLLSRLVQYIIAFNWHFLSN
jgi:hypothetical protein